MTGFPRLYAISDSAFGDPVKLSAALFDGGARLVQVRNKTATSRELLRQVEEILRIAPPDARVIVNDRADVTRISGAAGVHLGQADLPPVAARKILASDQLIGYSTHNIEQALEAVRFPVDYIAAGPVFPTQTKKDADPVIGLDGLREICRQAGKPVIAIGGIRLETAAEVLACGAAAVAVISDILKASDVSRRTREWLQYV